MPEDFETRYEKFESFLIRFLYKRFFISVPSRIGVLGKRRIFSKALFLFDCLSNCVGHSGESAVCVSRRSVGVNQGETDVWQPLV